jgi:hypothetical protein
LWGAACHTTPLTTAQVAEVEVLTSVDEQALNSVPRHASYFIVFAAVTVLRSRGLRISTLSKRRE